MYYVKNLSYKYKKNNEMTLKQVNFEIKPGMLNVLVGENGSGKTTIMDCITKSLNSDFDNNFPKINEILYMTQNIFFAPSNSGKDVKNLIKGLSSKKVVDNFDEMLVASLSENEKEKYNHLLNINMGEMSVGERKWLYLQLFSKITKKLYLFDEPTSGVDPVSRKLIMKRLESLVRHNRQCLISTHQLQDLQHIKTNIIFLHNGCIVYQGDFHEWLKINGTNNPDIAFERTIN